jgi:Ureidoglycolate lyase
MLPLKVAGPRRVTWRTFDVCHAKCSPTAKDKHDWKSRYLSDIHIPDKLFFQWDGTQIYGHMSSLLQTIKVTTSTDSLTVDGQPDLANIQAFIAMGNQGIVYEANRWHSPMCALDQVSNIPNNTKHRP